MLKVLISVIVPLYYGKKYIPDILNMMIKNSEKLEKNQFIEVLFINDSPDETVEIENIFNIKELTVKLFANDENMGIHYSRVKGLNHADGAFVMFFDQDDKIEDNYFASQLRHIRKADVIVANGIAQYPEYDKMLYRYWIMQWTIKHIWFYAKFGCRIMSPGQCLIRKDSIPTVWKENILKNNGADDYFLWLVMLSSKARFEINREKLYNHVYTSVNASLDNNIMMESVKELIEKQQGISSKYCRMIEKRIMQEKTGIVCLVERLNRMH